MIWRFWWRWILLTTIGFNVAFFISIGVAIILMGSRNPFIVFGLGALAGASGSIFLGIAQWAVLRGRIAKAYRWIIATTGSITLSCALGAVIGSITDSAFIGYMSGGLLSLLTLSYAQGRLLGQEKVVAWFLIILVGLGAGTGVGFLASILAMIIISQLVGGGWNTLGTVVLGGVLVGSTLGSSLFGAMTGRVLILLLE